MPLVKLIGKQVVTNQSAVSGCCHGEEILRADQIIERQWRRESIRLWKVYLFELRRHFRFYPNDIDKYIQSDAVII